METEPVTEYVTIEIGKLRVPKVFYDWVRDWCKLTNTNIEDFWKGALYYSINKLRITLQENPLVVLRLLRKEKQVGLI